MSEELTGELISKWISFKLYPDLVEEPFFSSEVKIHFVPSKFQYSDKKDVKNFLKDFFTQGNSDYSLEVISSKMDIEGSTLEEDMKVSVISKHSTLKWLCSKELSYYNISGRRVIFNLKMILQFSDDLLVNINVEWNPQELEESLVSEEFKEETPIEVHEKNNTLVEGPDNTDANQDKKVLESEIKKEEKSEDNQKEDLKISHGAVHLEASENTKVDSSGELLKNKTPESELEEIDNVALDNSGKHLKSKTPENEPEEIENIEKPHIQEGEKAEVDTLVDSEGSVNSRSPVPSNTISSLINKFENNSQEDLSLKPNKKPTSKLVSKSDSKLEVKNNSENKSKIAIKQSSGQNKALSSKKNSNGIVKPETQLKKSTIQKEKNATKSKTSFRKEAPVISHLKASNKPKDIKPATNQLPSKPKSSSMAKSAVSSPSKALFKSRGNQISNDSSNNSSHLKARSASQLSTRKTSRPDLKSSSFSTMNHMSRPIIRSSLQARNLNTTFTLGNEIKASDNSKSSSNQDPTWSKNLRPYLNDGSTGIKL